MHTVIETAPFLADAKATGMTDAERLAAIDLVSSNPQSGEVMQGTGGCRKVRVAGRGKGKSGGYRIILAFGGDDLPVFLLTVFGKGEKDNLTKAERNDLKAATSSLFEAYRRRTK